MKIVIADCSAIYTGRGDTFLPRGIRVIMIKRDGTVSIHNDDGIKPLNYMKQAIFQESTTENGDMLWSFDSRKESLSITMYNIVSSNEESLIENDPGLVRDGTEDHLQEWLAKNVQILGDECNFSFREYPTGNGPVDILVLDKSRIPIAVEVKRTAMLSSVDQCRRYVEALKDEAETNTEQQQMRFRELAEANSSNTSEWWESIDFANTIGMIAAVDIRPKTLEHAEKKGIMTFTIPSDWRKSANNDHNDSLGGGAESESASSTGFVSAADSVISD